MKTIFKISLFIGLIIFFSCKFSYEKKIIHEIKRTNYFKDLHISKIQIVDTIFQNDVNLSIKLDSIKLSNLEYKLKKLNLTKDSLKIAPKKDLSDRNEYFENIFYNIRHYERKILISENRQENYQKINYQDQDSICGYKILIYYNKNIDEFIISKYYELICPSFILDKDENKPQPRIKN